MKKLLLLLLLLSTLSATEYRFHEARYSDALGKTMQLSGAITFEFDKLIIKYDNSQRAIVYEDEEVKIYQGEQELDLDENEALKIAQYFEIIRMLYDDNTEKIKREFVVLDSSAKTVLKPIAELKNAMEKIELHRKNKHLKDLKLYLNNSDTIKISIENEIH